MKRFEGQIVIVTGAGQGIGFAIAEKFAKEGATVIATGRTLSKVEKTAQLLEDYDVVPWSMDCGIEEDWKKLIAHVKETYGALDVLVNNAGIEIGKDILAMTFEEFQKVESCNVDSVFLGMKYAHGVLKKGENASIVNISSVGAIKTGPATGNDGSYAATKAAVNQLSYHAAYHFAPDRIRVNYIMPAGVKTPLLDDFFANTPNAAETLKALNPLPPHIADPVDIANACAFLASEDARCITGAEIKIDEGMTVA